MLLHFVLIKKLMKKPQIYDNTRAPFRPNFRVTHAGHQKVANMKMGKRTVAVYQV